jgi:quercetin dioxygenase-like cupin family protein
MRSIGFFAGFCVLLVCGSAVAQSSSQTQSTKANPLILEKDEGERRVWRPIEGLDSQLSLFILKVDPHNGGSSHLVFGTEDVPVGGKIDAHRHPGSDEILFLQNGSAKVSLGDKTRDVHGGATVFIPPALGFLPPIPERKRSTRCLFSPRRVLTSSCGRNRFAKERRSLC